MDYPTPIGYEYLGKDAKYIGGDISTRTKGSIVPAKAIEILLRELHNVVALTGLEPSETDHTQLYQAIRDIGMYWSEIKNYRKITLVIGSNNKLYTLKNPSGPDVYIDSIGNIGPKNPINNPLYWTEFDTFKDNGVDNLDELVVDIQQRIDELEPTIQEVINDSILTLINMHPNNGIATTSILGHVTGGNGVVIDDYGKVNLNVDNITLQINSKNQLEVIESAIKPPVATDNIAGIVKIDQSLSITEEILSPPVGYRIGVLSLKQHNNADVEIYGGGTFQNYGHVKLTDDLEETTTAADSVVVTPKAVKDAYDSLLGLKVDTVITTSREWIAPATAAYTVTIVGGGGNGGSNGASAHAKCCVRYSDRASRPCIEWAYADATGGAGGGGGAGETITTTVTLTKGTKVQVTIGGSGGGTTSFGSHATARGGGNGGNGGNGYASISGDSCGVKNQINGGLGTIGTSYGSPAGYGTGGRSVQGQYGNGGNTSSVGTQGVCIIKTTI